MNKYSKPQPKIRDFNALTSTRNEKQKHQAKEEKQRAKAPVILDPGAPRSRAF